MKKLIVLPITLVLTLLIVSTIACGSSQTVITYCAAGCLTSQLGDGTCDDACNNAACSYDSGDCTECAPGCYQSWVGNGYCYYKCNVAACNYDGGDCSYNPTATQSNDFCSGSCQWSWVGDGECDSSLGCNVAACNYDGGDCEISECPAGYVTAANDPSMCCEAGYPYYWPDDGMCHTSLPYAAPTPTQTIQYCATGCPYFWVGDGYCDDTCNNYACDYDGGDCPMYGDLCIASNGYIGIYDSAGDCSYCANYDSNHYMDTICGGSNCGTVTNGVCCCVYEPTPTYSYCSTGYSRAINDPSICCQNGYPYYWSSDGRCHTSAPTPTPNTTWRENIRSGDIVLAPERASGFGHVGICYGTNYVIEALGNGVARTPIAEWDDTPGIYVLRVDCSDSVANEAAYLATTQEGKAYQDWFFYLDKSSDLGSSYWYCSELVWGVYKNVGIDLEYTPDNLAISPWEIYMSTQTQVIYHHGPPDILHPDETFLWDSDELLDFSYWAE